MKHIVALVCSCLLACAVHADRVVVLEARHRPADELVEALRPLLLQGEALSASGNQLIVRADDAGIERIKETLSQIDRPLRQVQISVRRATAATVEREMIAARARASAGTLHVQAYGTEADSRINAEGVSRVVVREGSEAFVDTSSSVPQFAGAVIETRSSGAARTIAGVDMRELHSGFHISPHLTGNHVQLEISAQTERADGDVISTQRASSQVSGELGVWLRIGSVSNSGTQGTTSLSGHALSTRAEDLEWWVRVDEMGSKGS